MKRIGLLIMLLPLAWISAPRAAQPPPSPTSTSGSPGPPGPPGPAVPAADEDKKDEGIPVTSEVVRQKCSACHKADDKNRMSRISYRRTTPEGWEMTIKRMVTLNSVKLEPAEARDVLRYLSDQLGLAPEEAKPADFEVERRQIDYQYASDKEGDKEADKDKRITEQTCIACHSIGRVISQRRSKEEWELLVAMHRGYYWLADFQAFRRTGPLRREPEPDGRPPDNRHPMDVAIAHLSSAFPLATPAWSAWSATMRPPQLKGTWALSGYQLGKGPVYGTVTISPQGLADSSEFTTQATYTIPQTGEHITRTGQAIVYTGFQWRGRSSEPGSGHPLREVMFIDRDWRHAEGRWFAGAYDEIGIDVRLERLGADPVVTGVAQPMIRAGASNQEVRLFGANLPARLAASDLSFGPGVTVDRVATVSADQVVVSLSVAKTATPGRRTVLVAGATGDATIAVYDTVDFIKVTPQAGLARVGGANFPKQLQQFEAVAYANGPDGKPNTKDDIQLGLVDASWTIEEYTATFEDDDKDFVGAIDAKTGLFTPALDGPNPKRRNNANNYGDVWVVASYQPKYADGQPPPGARALKARAHLLVTVPLYMKWDEPEVAR
jgi:quinohemoprotein amine dehydrogenase